MHEASFEMIEIPHVCALRQELRGYPPRRGRARPLLHEVARRLFVIVSGDSDFSPLVSKLRENNKTVIGRRREELDSPTCLIENCDEFIYYDDLVRQDETKQRSRRKQSARKPAAESQKDAPKGDEERKLQAFDLVLDTIEALAEERDQDEKIWGSMVKQTLKRRNPGFNESYYGFRTFSELLEEAQKRQLLTLEADQKSGGYIVRGHVRPDDQA
jgi:hypothetical protein